MKPRAAKPPVKKPPYKDKEATTRMDPGGRITIPPSFRKKLGLKPGADVTITLDDEGLHVWSFEGRMRRIREVARMYVPEGTLVSEELIEDRKREAALE